MGATSPRPRFWTPITGVLPAVASLLLMTSLPAGALDLQGHRGARGLFPENTLAGFARALALGVTTLELDLGVSADGHVVVSHDRRLNPALTRTPDGRWLQGPLPPVHSLTLAELRRFDVGRVDPASRYARRFPHQRALDGERIPTLAEALALAPRGGTGPVHLNVETKLSPLEPALTPPPKVFAHAVVRAVRDAGAARRVTIQSFDWRTLRHVQSIAPEIQTAYLTAQQEWLDNIEAGRPGVSAWTAGLDVDDHGGSVPELVHAAGGDVWSPYYRELDAAQMQRAKELDLRVIVWTVNEVPDMHRLVDMGVDGIITDYPDRLREVARRRGLVPIAVQKGD